MEIKIYRNSERRVAPIYPKLDVP